MCKIQRPPRIKFEGHIFEWNSFLKVPCQSSGYHIETPDDFHYDITINKNQIVLKRYGEIVAFTTI